MAAKSSTAASTGSTGTDAIELLLADHRNVEKLFRKYDKLVEDGGTYNASSNRPLFGARAAPSR
jgi:hypothetical protein